MPPDEGTYTVTYQVTDDDGLTGTDTAIISVLNAAAVVNAGPDLTAVEGTAVLLGGVFTDAGHSDTHTLVWHITADNGQVIADSTGPQLSFTPADDGTYTATLSVTDNDGATGSDTVVITVDNAAPRADGGADQTVVEGETVTLRGTASDAGTADTHTLAWQVADAAGQTVAEVTGAELRFVPTDNGTYRATLQVTDDDGQIGTDMVTITAQNANPFAEAGFDQTVDEGERVTLVSTIRDPGTSDTLLRMWRVTGPGDQLIPIGRDENFQFVPADNGTYTVTFQVTDDDRGVARVPIVVTVRNAPPVADAGPDQTAGPHDLVRLSGRLTDPGTADTHRFVWRATSSTGQLLAQGARKDFSFVPVEEGVYTVTLHVADDDGVSSSDSALITVDSGCPTC